MIPINSHHVGPIKLSTVYLLNTYQSIQRLRENRANEEKVKNRTISAPYYNPEKDELLKDGKYKVLEILGKGSFGVVVKAEVNRELKDTTDDDEDDDDLVAIKIIRKGTSFLQQGRREFEILSYIKDKQKAMKLGKEFNLFVKAKETFFHNGHLCIVFELLADSLFDLVRCSWAVNPEKPGLSLRMVRKMTHQLLCALVALKNLKIIHCDIKPENIALIQPNKPRLKILDFGSCCFVSDSLENQFPYIQSRYYRAPEILLGTGYECSIDMWSLGCVMLELYLGKPLFVGKDSVHQLFKIIEIIGMPPDKMLNNAAHFSRYFMKDAKKNVPIYNVCEF